MERGSLRSDLQIIVVQSSPRKNNHATKLKTSVLQSGDKKRKLNTNDADIRARRMGDIFPHLVPENEKSAVTFTMTVSVATFCEIIYKSVQDTATKQV